MGKLVKIMTGWLQTFPRRIYDAFLRFPLSMLCAAALFVTADVHEHTVILDDKIFFKLIFTLIIGFVLFAAAELVLESFGAKKMKYRIAAWVITYVPVQGYYFLADGQGDRGVAQFAMIAAAACLFAVVSLNVKSGKSFEQNVARIVVRAASSALFATVLFAGLSAIVGSVDLLLTDVDHKWYGEVARICYIIFLPVMFLMGLPEKDDEAAYPKPLKALLTYVVVPVIMIFTVVLYIYYIKLIITRSLPISEAGGVSLAFLGACIPTLILITPFDNRLSMRLRSIIPFVLIPVIFVLFLAAGRQIAGYGVTVPRYLVIIGGMASLISVLLIRIKGGSKQRIACLVVAAACVISAHGPQSAYNSTQDSQNHRLGRYLAKNDMLGEDGIIPNANASDEDKREIVGIINFLERNDLEKPEYIPDDISDFEAVFGFKPENIAFADRYFRTESMLINVSGFDYIRTNGYYKEPKPSEGGFEISTFESNGILTVRKDGAVLCEISKQEIAAQIYNKIDLDSELQSPESLTYDYENEKIKIRVAFRSITLNVTNKSDLYRHGDYSVLIKEK